MLRQWQGCITKMMQQLHMRRMTHTNAQRSSADARRRLRAALQALAAHTAESRRRRAAAEASAALRKECVVRATMALWSGWAATRRQLRATSDVVRPFALLPAPTKGRPCTPPRDAESSQAKNCFYVWTYVACSGFIRRQAVGEGNVCCSRVAARYNVEMGTSTLMRKALK